MRNLTKGILFIAGAWIGVAYAMTAVLDRLTHFFAPLGPRTASMIGALAFGLWAFGTMNCALRAVDFLRRWGRERDLTETSLLRVGVRP